MSDHKEDTNDRDAYSSESEYDEDEPATALSFTVLLLFKKQPRFCPKSGEKVVDLHPALGTMKNG